MRTKIKNNFEKVKWKTKLGIFTIATLLWLSWCWGWDWWNTTNSNNSINDWVTNIKVQAWITVWANVEIKTLDWEYLWTYISGENWEILINQNEIIKKLNELWLSETTKLELVSTWWIDIDPDDDWNTSNDIDKEIYGQMTSIWNILELDNTYINPLTTLTSELLKKDWINYENIRWISWEIDINKVNRKIEQILRWINVKDINLDWKVSYSDISQYDMISNQSALETNIVNNWYLEYIHSWNINIKENYVNNLILNIDWYWLELPEEVIDLQISWLNQDYTPLELLDEVSFNQKKDELKTQINNIDWQIKEIELSLDVNKEKQIKIETSIEKSKTEAHNYYNSLDSNSRILLDPNKTYSEKYNQTNQIIANISSTQSKSIVYASSYVSNNISSINLPSKTEVTEWKQALIDREIKLEKEIEPLKKEKEEKEKIYNKKYNEYLQAKADYDEDQRLKKYYNDRYYEYRNKYNELKSDYDTYIRFKNLASDNYQKSVSNFPKSSAYTVSSYTNSNYINKITTVSKIIFSYRWINVKWYFQFSNKWWFPWKLWIDYNWITQWNKITINSTQHLDRVDDLIVEASKYDIDYDYYKKLADDITNSWNLKKYADIRDDADISRFLYWLLELVDKDFYSDALNDYNQAKDEYNQAKSNLQIKIDLLEEVKRKLETYWIKIDTIEKYTNDLLVVQTEYLTTENEVVFLSWTKEELQKEYQVYSESNPEIENEKKYIKILNWYNPSKNFIQTIKVAKWEKWYTYIDPNKIDYNNFPYTSYIKINRTKLNSWEISVYPALIWIEYKLWNNNIVYSTERLEAQNYEQIQEIEKYLQEKVRERQDLNKNITEKELYNLYYYLKISSQNWWIWDWINNNFKWINRLTFDSDLDYFAWVLIDYKLKTDSNFKNWYDIEIDRQKKLNPDLDIQEIEKWVKDWITKATRDYLMQYIDLAEDLSQLTLDDISNWLNWIWNTIKEPEKIINAFINQLYDLKTTLNTALDKLIWLWTYEKTYWWTYVWTTLWLIVWDPWKKISSLLWAGWFKEQWLKALKTIWELQKSYRLEVLRIFEDITQAQRDRLYSLMLKYDIKNPLNLIHINYGEWEYVTINGVLEKRLKWWLHNMNVVEELLKEGDVKIGIKKNWKWVEIPKEEYFNLPDDSYDKLNPRIKWFNDSRKINQISKNQKSLFPKNWTDEDIAEAIKKAEENIKDILINQYNLPLKWTPWSYWKNMNLDNNEVPQPIIKKIKLDNWKEKELDLWWRYDNEWNLDFSIITLYPNN